MEKQEIKNNIVYDAFYLVNLFTNSGRPVTQLHIQKLMYLFEAYYMNAKNTDKLYDCDYQAWIFGPVATPLYKNFKKYGKQPIELTEEEKKLGNSIDSEKKELLNQLFETFKDFKAMQLVNFTHAHGSPWYIAWNEKKYSIIPKKDIKDWFKKYVKKES